MGKNDPMKGSANDYAKKAKQRSGKPDPLQEIDDESLAQEMPQRPGRESQEQTRDRSRGQQEMLDDVQADDRWDT
jgi:hypothetical protein